MALVVRVGQHVAAREAAAGVALYAAVAARGKERGAARVPVDLVHVRVSTTAGVLVGAEGDEVGGLGGPPARVGILGVVEAHLPGVVAAGQHGEIGRERHALDAHVVLELPHEGPGGRVPDLDLRLVLAAGHEVGVVGGEREALRLGAAVGHPQRLPRGGVEEPHRAVALAHGGDPLLGPVVLRVLDADAGPRAEVDVEGPERIPHPAPGVREGDDRPAAARPPRHEVIAPLRRRASAKRAGDHGGEAGTSRRKAHRQGRLSAMAAKACQRGRRIAAVRRTAAIAP